MRRTLFALGAKFSGLSLIPLAVFAAFALAVDFKAVDVPWAVVDQPYTPAAQIAYGTARCPAPHPGRR